MHVFFMSIAGYNHLEVAEYLLETGADVNAQDKGGLIPLHNASSYGVSMFDITKAKLRSVTPFFTENPKEDASHPNVPKTLIALC